MPDKNTRWENDKEWAGWTVRDEVYGFVRAHLAPIVSAMMAGIAGTIFSALKSHWSLATTALGASTATVALMIFFAQLQGRRKTAAAVAREDALSISGEKPKVAEPMPSESDHPSDSQPATTTEVQPAHLDIESQGETETRFVTPVEVEETETAVHAFNRFNPPRPFYDLPEDEWRALGTLYSMEVMNSGTFEKPRQSRFLILRFLPDSRPQAPFSLLLLLYGYLRIFGLKHVNAAHLEECLFRSGVEEPRGPLDFLTATAMFASRRYNVDEVAKSIEIDHLISEKLGLSEEAGGYYFLTERGVQRAAGLFADLVRRA